MNGRPYVTAHYLADLRTRLTEVDWAIVADVRQMRLASARDLQALQQLRAPLQVRSFRRRLQQLHELGVLARLERTVGGQRAGSAGFVYRLGSAGQRLLANEHGGAIQRPWTPRPAWLRHALAASHLYVVLRLAEAEQRLRLLDYQPEPLAWRRFQAVGGQAVTLKPDGFARYELPDALVSSFLEVDCASESPATIARKLGVYIACWQSGQALDSSGVFPETLWLVPDQRRRAVLQRVIDQHPAEARRLFRVGCYDQARQLFTEPPP
ncbi:MAG TPA: replication-relaxation family protein [Acidimicrobiales bacterium]|nr:replication-relaxation family protein [Acidimicrobiales bacterium]